MSKKFISVLLLIIFLSVFANVGGVTNIKEVVNNTAGVVKLLKRDFTGNAITTRIENTPEIAAGTTWKGDMWVPWANNAEEFKNHFMQLYQSSLVEGRQCESRVFTFGKPANPSALPTKYFSTNLRFPTTRRKFPAKHSRAANGGLSSV